MKKSYDFSKSTRNPYVKKTKTQLTIRLDEDTIEYFRELAEESGIPYQSLINLYLRECAARGKGVLEPPPQPTGRTPGTSVGA